MDVEMSDPDADDCQRALLAEQQRLSEVKRELNRQAIRLVQERCETSLRQLSAIYRGPISDSSDCAGL